MATRDGKTIRASAGAETRRKIRDDEGSILHGVTGQMILLSQSQIELSREINRGTQLKVFRGTADQHGIVARIGVPAFCSDVIVGKSSAIQSDRNMFCFTRSKLHSREAFQFLCRPGNLRADFTYIYLRDIGTCALAGVRDIK